MQLCQKFLQCYDKPVATGHSGTIPPKFCCALESFFKTYNKNKNFATLKVHFFPEKMYFAPQNFNTWLWACVAVLVLSSELRKGSTHRRDEFPQNVMETQLRVSI